MIAMRLITTTLLLVLITTRAHGQTDAQKQFAKELERTFKKNTVTLRVFDGRSELNFHRDGTPAAQPELGPWTLNSKLEVSRVKVKPDALILDAFRLWPQFDDKTGKIAHYIRSSQDVRLRIQIAPNEEPPEIQSALSRVLVPANGSMKDLVPEEWQDYFSDVPTKGLDTQCKGCSQMVGDQLTYRAGGDVEPPKATYGPDPEFNEAARRSRWQGTLTLWVVVTAEGKPYHIRVLKPLGCGLDEEAIDAIRTWKFEPATKKGVPVASQINVEVGFKLSP
jgi:TonB family protein